MARHLKLKTADIIIEARCSDPRIQLCVSPDSRAFLTKEGEPDCLLDVHYGPLPNIRLERKLFDSEGGAWVLHNSGQDLVFQLLCGHERPQTHRMAILGPQFARGELFICPQLGNQPHAAGSLTQEPAGSIVLDPFTYPLDELLVVNLLAQGRGLHIHALGVVHQGQGLVFCGVSGAGKSTLAQLWKSRGVEILSDDRLSLRKQDGKIWVYGSPWHGDARVSLPEKAPLKVIYFIAHGRENRIVPLSVTEVAIRLLVRCFPTFYLAHGMEYTMGFIAGLAQDLPCYELQFTPRQSVIDEVLDHVGSRLY